MVIFEKDIAIDMGTSSTLVFEQGKGVVLREPTVVAVDKFSGKILNSARTPKRCLAVRRRISWRSIRSAPA